MKIRLIQFFIFTLFSLLILSCDSPSKENHAETKSNDVAISKLNEAVSDVTVDANRHEVVVTEVLNTAEYTYLKVREKGDLFWIATVKLKKPKIGDTYLYKGGIKKKNFRSREFNRVFEILYLVSDIWKEPVAGKNIADAHKSIQTPITNTPVNIPPAKGAIPINELIKKSAEYNGKKVTVTGKCVKFNPMIMERNWVHLIDGTITEGNLTVTTKEKVAVGAVVTFEGIIVRNKDFGAGYKYDVLMEEAVLK